MIKNICCIGAGYVGGPTMAVIAEKCPDIKVNVVDIDKKRIDLWNSTDSNKLPIYEPGLSELIKNNRGKNLFFSTNIKKAIEESEIIFLAVNTPTKFYGKGKGMASELKNIELATRSIATYSNTNKIIVEKSTLPVKTANSIKSILKNTNKKFHFEVISNPEFLAEGTGINDLINADRVLIGGENTKKGNEAVESLSKIYEKWLPKNKIIKTNLWSSELSKLVANAFLAQRVSSINSISALCESTGANIGEVSKAIGLDSRIGEKFLNTSPGFGGSCFQKDILNLVYISKSLGLNEVSNYWKSVITMNNYQKNRIVDIVIEKLHNTIAGKKIILLGWAFKKDTNDSRESPSIYIANSLLEENANLHVIDPKVKLNQIKNDVRTLDDSKKQIIEQNLTVSKYDLEVFKDAHAIIVLTEWEQFIEYDYASIFNKMIKPAFIFDTRRILNKNKLIKIGYETYFIGE